MTQRESSRKKVLNAQSEKHKIWWLINGKIGGQGQCNIPLIEGALKANNHAKMYRDTQSDEVNQ